MTLTAFTEQTSDVLALELAQHIESLTGKSDLSPLCSSLDTAESYYVLCNALIDNSGALLNESDEYAEASICAIINLCNSADADHMESLLQKLVTLVETGPAERSTIRIKLLAFLFNSMDVECSSRFTCYTALVRVCGESGKLNAVLRQFENLPDWLVEWKCSQTQRRELYHIIFDACKKCDLSAEARKYQTIYLESFSASDAKEAKNVAQETVIDAIRDSKCYIFDELINLDAVKALEGVSALFDLLKIFFSGDYSAFVAFESKNSDVFDHYKLDKAACSKKMKLLTLVSLSTDTSEVDYKQVAESLSVSDEEVELWLIEAMRTELVTGKLDQLNEKVIVRRAMRRTFGKENWLALSERLESWSAAMGECLETLRTVRTQQEAGQKNNQSGSYNQRRQMMN
eukprot:CFRG8412T1